MKCTPLPCIYAFVVSCLGCDLAREIACASGRWQNHARDSQTFLKRDVGEFLQRTSASNRLEACRGRPALRCRAASPGPASRGLDISSGDEKNLFHSLRSGPEDMSSAASIIAGSDAQARYCSGAK